MPASFEFEEYPTTDEVTDQTPTFDDAGLTGLCEKEANLKSLTLDVEIDDDVGAPGDDVHRVPLQLFADFVFVIAFGEPLGGVDAAAEFAGCAAADVDLIAASAGGVFIVAEVDAAIVFAVLVDHEVEG